jgi:hypothetical protein
MKLTVTLLLLLLLLLAALVATAGAVAQPPAPWSTGKDCVAGCSGKSSEHCAKCADDPKEPSWSCGTCCPGYVLKKELGGAYCEEGKGPIPPPPPPAPPGSGYECYQGT